MSGNVGCDDMKFDCGGDFDEIVYGVEVGYLLVLGLLIVVGFKGWDNDCDDGVDLILCVKYVIIFLNGKDINFEVGVVFGDLDEYNFVVDYFIDKILSLGVDYYSKDCDYGDINEFGINVCKFFIL